MLGAVLAAHPHLIGVLFDQEHVIAGAEQVLSAAGVVDRCEIVAGSFFSSVPEGGDAYVLKSIIHDWEDEESVAILRACRAAMRPQAVVLLIERDLGRPNENLTAKLSDLNMFVMPGGRERTVEEYAALLQQAGLDFTSSHPTATGQLVIEAGVQLTAMVEFTLDGRTVSAPEGELLVHAAARHGTFIPTLCHDSKLDPYGGCRMCVVDVEGAPRPMPACATRVSEGMVVSTNGPITDFQRTLTEMLLSEHLNESPGGRPNELLDLANELGAEAPLVLPDAKRAEYDDRNRLMGYDPDACILCARCVRYTQEVMQCSALSLEGRGGHARIVPTWEL